MGLDMYLRAETFVSGSRTRGEFKAPEDGLELPGMSVMEIVSVPNERASEYERILEIFEDAKASVDPEHPYATISLNVAYWRKANQIHSWFVNNVQGGADDCKPYEVSREKLRELREACLRVLAAELTPAGVSAVAEEHLPTQPGFFFGGTEYNEWYFRNLRETVEQLDRALALDEGKWYFVYESSW